MANTPSPKILFPVHGPPRRRGPAMPMTAGDRRTMDMAMQMDVDILDVLPCMEDMRRVPPVMVGGRKRTRSQDTPASPNVNTPQKRQRMTSGTDSMSGDESTPMGSIGRSGEDEASCVVHHRVFTGVTPPARRWVFTWNNPVMTAPECSAHLMQDASIRYAVFQSEVCPTTGTPHFQGYVELASPQRRSWMIAMMGEGRVHYEIARGNRVKCRDYCM